MEFLLETIMGLFTLALLLRIYLQLVRVPAHHPLLHAVIIATDFGVKPLARIVPKGRRLDGAALVLAWATQLLLELATLWWRDFPLLVADVQVFIALPALALLGIAKLVLYLLIYAVLLQAILSWVHPHSPAGPLLDSMTRPWLNPLRRYVPRIGMVDLTPLVAFIAAELLLIALIAPLEYELSSLF